MKKKLNYILLFLVVGFTLTISVNAVSTKVSLSCDKTKLKYGESTDCYIELESNEKLSEWYGRFNIGEGLSIKSATSLNKNYNAILNDDSIVLSVIENDDESPTIKTSSFITQLNKQKIIKLNVAANKNANIKNSTIELETLKDCNSNLMGDLKFDNVVDATDALEALKIEEEKVTLENRHILVGDFNSNNGIDEDDAIHILKLIVNKINPNISDNMGDANDDGNINEDDAKYVLRYSVGKVTIEDPEELTKFKSVSDLNADGEIDAVDALIILKLINNKDTMSGVISKNFGKYFCFSVNSNELGRQSEINFNLTSEVNVPPTGESLSILLSILSIALVVIGIMFMTKTKKEQN